ncbi:MAG: cation:proton antiporter [Clostridia bacterium]
MSYKFLIDIALILISTKLLGIITKRFHMPQVVGALLAGIVLGPAAFNILQETDFLSQIAELGVIVIMFSAGMGTSVKDLRATGKAGFVVAMIGVIVPLVMGTALAYFFNRGALSSGGNILLQNIFIGVVFTATSVSITVEALREMGKLNTKVGDTILAAAIIDDVLGMIALTIVTSFAGADTKIYMILIKIALFIVFCIAVGYLAYRLLNWYAQHVNQVNLHRFPIAGFVLCLVFSYCAEQFFGMADITGAFVAGMVVASCTKGKYIESKFEPLSYLLLSPIFFASIGINMQITNMSGIIIVLAVLMVIIAIISKLIGCGIGAKLCGFTARESIQTGLGMVCRGEVALIIANRGAQMGLMPEAFFNPLIIMIIATTIITPVLLKLAFRKDTAKSEDEMSRLALQYNKTERMDIAAQEMLDEHDVK